MLREDVAELVAPPDPLPRVEVTLPWTKVADSTWNRGTLVMGFQDCLCKVSDDSGKEIGYVTGVFGGYLEICINHEDGTFELWRLDPRDSLAHRIGSASKCERGKGATCERKRRRARTTKRRQKDLTLETSLSHAL